MKKVASAIAAVLVAVTALHSVGAKAQWAMNATAIEACSCPMFCQCYFNTKPAAHHEGSEAKHYCEFNMAYKINKGHHGSTKLDGMKFWITGDLGDDFGDGATDWAIVTFDKSSTPEQRQALGEILPKVFPVKWGSFKTAEGTIDKWEITDKGAHATLDGGKSAEIKLKAFAGMDGKQVKIPNLAYFAAPRNDGFIMYPSELQAHRRAENAFEHKNSNGFLITIDINSNDVKSKGGMTGY